MGVVTYEYEIVSTLPAARLFNAYLLNPDKLYPKVIPGAFKSFENLQGDGGAGTIKLITFGDGSPFRFAKHRVDEVDKGNFVFKYSMIEGDALGEELESISFVVKIIPGADGGSVVKISKWFHSKSDTHSITVEKIKKGTEKTKAHFRAIEAYLNDHPHEYNEN